MQSAKDVANSTAALVKAIKALDSEFTEQNRLKCAEAAKPLIDAVDELSTFASSPEFASMPAKISHEVKDRIWNVDWLKYDYLINELQSYCLK